MMPKSVIFLILQKNSHADFVCLQETLVSDAHNSAFHCMKVPSLQEIITSSQFGNRK